MAYDIDTKIECRRLYVHEGMSLRAICRLKGGRPSILALTKWAKEVDPETGLTWEQERQAKIKEKYERLTPSQRAEKLLERLDKLLADETMEGAKFANALAQISRALQDMKDPLFILPIRLETIRLLADWIAENARQYNTPKVMRILQEFGTWLTDRAMKES